MTTDLPTKPGWYHYNGPEAKSGMIYVYQGLQGLCWLSVDAGALKLLRGEVKDLTASFQGPLANPFE